MKTDFRPPLESRLVVHLLQLVIPLIARRWWGIVRIDISAADSSRLRDLGRGRLLLCPNHPTLADPVVVFMLARRLGLSINFMAARELFDGPLGWVLQHGGAYSVLRGTADREALRTTRRLLAQDDRRIAVFPEGVSYEQNDLLLPFHSTVIQVGFWALEDLEKLGKDVHLPVAPVAIKYVYQGNAPAAVLASLARLERALGLVAPPAEGPYARLRSVGESVVARLEKEYGLRPAPDTPLAARIAAAKERVVVRVAEALGTRLAVEAPLSERLHVLDSALRAYADEFAGSRIPYERRLHRERQQAERLFARDLRRLYTFLAVTDGYVAAAMTAERFLHVLGRLEQEVLGRRRLRGHWRAVVRVGEPLSLEQFYADYRANKRAAVAAATRDLERRVEALLRPLGDLGTPMAPAPPPCRSN